MTAILVIDVGTTGLRAAIVDEHLTIRHLAYRECAPSSPVAGLVEFDATAMAASVLDAANTVISASGRPVDAVGITNQRASTLIWDRTTGEPVAPGLGWQDLRTVGECMAAKAEHGWALAPNQSVTKIAWLLANTPDLEGRELCFGTVDSWVVWTLSQGAVHVSDQSNASTTITGLRHVDGASWNAEICDAFSIPTSSLPQVVDSVGVLAAATALPGNPPIASLIGDQQASLVGQSCVTPGQTKITFGTGGMLDVCTGADAPASVNRRQAGTYPLPLWSHNNELTWGVEGIMLSAGSNVEWLRDDLGLIETSAESHDVASQCNDTEGVVYVPALLGLGTPHWDYGARGTLLGITRGTERSHVVRAVLEGVAHRGADLVDAAIADTGLAIDTIRIDGGMSTNPTFAQAFADATNRPVEIAPVAESTTIGAAFMAGLAIGTWEAVSDIEGLWSPSVTLEPRQGDQQAANRARWADAIERSAGWLPELSALDF